MSYEIEKAVIGEVTHALGRRQVFKNLLIRSKSEIFESRSNEKQTHEIF
jgi:hypothetical protein